MMTIKIETFETREELKGDEGIGLPPNVEAARELIDTQVNDAALDGGDGCVPIHVADPLRGEDAADAIGELGSDLQIDYTAKLAAWLEALGVKPLTISARLGQARSYVYNLRTKAHYREMLRRCHTFIARHIVSSATDIDKLFNDQIGPSVATMIEIRDNPLEKGQTRLKAATEFLDRAPLGPKSRREVDERRTIIQIPVSALQTMQSALIETGNAEDREIHDLIEDDNGKYQVADAPKGRIDENGDDLSADEGERGEIEPVRF